MQYCFPLHGKRHIRNEPLDNGQGEIANTAHNALDAVRAHTADGILFGIEAVAVDVNGLRRAERFENLFRKREIERAPAVRPDQLPDVSAATVDDTVGPRQPDLVSYVTRRILCRYFLSGSVFATRPHFCGTGAGSSVRESYCRVWPVSRFRYSSACPLSRMHAPPDSSMSSAISRN
jgi:hypothetical protein